MAVMTASTRPTEPPRSDADLGQVITAVNGLIAKLGQRERVSPSVPLDAPDPSASIVYTDHQYDALPPRPPPRGPRARRSSTPTTSTTPSPSDSRRLPLPTSG